MSKTEAIRVNVDEETKAQLERLAAEQDVSLAHIVRRFIKAGLAAALVLLALVPTASADLRMTGEAKPRHFNWARMAQENVPLPDARFALYGDADPQYFPGLREMYLPTPGKGGWTYWDERVLFLHELGHVFDFTHLNRAERNAFRSAVGTTASWWSKKLRVPPGEMFAEAYSACALGMTLPERDAVPAVSYGWAPPQVDLCTLIRSFK